MSAVDRQLAAFEEHGYVVLPDVLAPAEVQPGCLLTASQAICIGPGESPQLLSIPQERARAMSPRLRQLLGYSIHPPFMGQIAGRHPEKSLAEGYVNSLDADDAEIASLRLREPRV